MPAPNSDGELTTLQTGCTDNLHIYIDSVIFNPISDLYKYMEKLFLHCHELQTCVLSQLDSAELWNADDNNCPHHKALFLDRKSVRTQGLRMVFTHSGDGRVVLPGSGKISGILGVLSIRLLFVELVLLNSVFKCPFWDDVKATRGGLNDNFHISC